MGSGCLKVCNPRSSLAKGGYLYPPYHMSDALQANDRYMFHIMTGDGRGTHRVEGGVESAICCSEQYELIWGTGVGVGLKSGGRGEKGVVLTWVPRAIRHGKSEGGMGAAERRRRWRQW
eukprot:762638-Hanusia_phi.AAC.6